MGSFSSIGDTREEVEIGKELGFKTVALTGGNNSTKILRSAKPDFLIHSLVELKEILKAL